MLNSLVSQLQRTPLDHGGEALLREILTRYNKEASTIWPFHMKEVWARKTRVRGMEIVPVELVDMRDVFVV